MENQSGGKVRIRVRLEPGLEEHAGELTPAQRLEMAAKLERWAHQLRVSAKVLTDPKKRPRMRVPKIRLAKLRTN